LDLADALPSDAEIPADVFKRSLGPAIQADISDPESVAALFEQMDQAWDGRRS
jgi:hypothetical protein